MAVTERDFAQAEMRAQSRRETGYAVSARYDRRSSRVVVKLHTDVQVSFPPRLAEGLADASPDELAEIEISPSGLGLYWPRLDADLSVSGLLAGQFGSRRWMDAQFHAAAANAPREGERSPAKVVKPREVVCKTTRLPKAKAINSREALGKRNRPLNVKTANR